MSSFFRRTYKYFVALMVFLCSFVLYFVNQAMADVINGGGFGIGGKAPRVYESCVFGYETNDLDNMLNALPSIITVKPLGSVCYQRCQRVCSEAFGIATSNDSNKNSDAKDQKNILAINKDLIEKCIITCQSGQQFSAPKAKRIYKDPTNANSTRPYNESENVDVAVKDVCTAAAADPSITPSTTSPDYIFYNSNVVVSSGEQVNVYMATPPAQDSILQDDQPNTVYLCGRKTVMLYPSFYSTKRNEWCSDNRKSCPKDSSERDVCTGAASGRADCTMLEHWNARNAAFTDTGIYIRDGDYLSITYSGRFHYYISRSADPSANPMPQDYILQIAKSTSDTQNLPGNLLQSYSTTVPPPKDEESAQKIADREHEDVKANDALERFLGLKGAVVPISSPSAFRQDHSINANLYNPNAFRMHTFSGILSKYSKQQFVPLLFRHYDEGKVENWGDNLGGYNVNVTWKGCKFQDGERLQYKFIDNNVMKNNSGEVDVELNKQEGWKDVPWEKAEKGPYGSSTFLPVPAGSTSKMNLFFRIKSLTQAEMSSTGLLTVFPDAYKTYNTSGQYTIGVKKLPKPECDGFIAKLIKNEIYTPLFGSFEGNAGIVTQFFNLFITNNMVIGTIKALLLLYITYTGLCFVAGISHITQKEATVRIVKIAIVLTLLSSNSWDFFNTRVFGLFTNGMVELIDNLTYSKGGAEHQSASCPPPINGEKEYKTPRVLSDFHKVLSQLFNEVFWQKFVALVFSGIVGFAIGIIVLAGVLVYFACMIKATMIYIISLFGIALLLMLAPFFIPLILFNYTKGIFDAWLKQLTVFTLQPVFVFGSIWFFQKILIMLLQVALSFTMCKVCLLGLVLPPFINLCLINVYHPLMTSHSPSHFSIPLTNVAEAICLIIVAQAMFVFCSFASTLAQRIVSFSTLDAGRVGAVGNFTAPITSGAGAVTHGAAVVTGMDSESRKIRSDQAKKGVDEKKEKRAKRDSIDR
ncbi:type IV secretion system protein VirB6 [Alphaproteobacteria bacterium]